MSVNLTEHLVPKIKKDDPDTLPIGLPKPKPRERKTAFDGFFYFTAALVSLTFGIQLFLMFWMEIF